VAIEKYPQAKAKISLAAMDLAHDKILLSTTQKCFLEYLLETLNN